MALDIATKYPEDPLMIPFVISAYGLMYENSKDIKHLQKSYIILRKFVERYSDPEKVEGIKDQYTKDSIKEYLSHTDTINQNIIERLNAQQIKE